jgi:hypothetical protein
MKYGKTYANMAMQCFKTRVNGTFEPYRLIKQRNLMSERSFRLIQGLYILTAQYFEWDMLLYAYIVLLGFEGVTNYRIPRLVSRLRYGKSPIDTEQEPSKYRFEAERALRLVVFTLLILTVVVFPESAWFFPWFIGAMLLMAGVTNICPMVMMFRGLGLR